MKFIKMLGLAAVAAAAVMAFAGASSAMAAETTLCKVDQLPCESANRYPSGTTIIAESTDAKLTTSIGTVECDSTVTDVLKAATGEPLPDEVTGLTWTNCHLGSTECTVKSINLNYLSELKWTASLVGTLTVKNHSKGGEPGATVECGFLINCTYTKNPLTLEALSGWNLASGKTPTGEVVAKSVELNRSGGFCPETSVWSAHYKLLSPEQIWVSHT